MRALSLAIAAILAGCSRYPPAASNAPPDDGWQPGNGAIISPIDTLPDVTVLQRTKNEVIVRIKNICSVPLEYGARNRNSINRFLEVEYLGKWQAESFDWCGMGLELKQLLPNDAIDVVVKFDNANRRERILGSFSEVGTEKQSFVVLAAEYSN